MNSHRFVERVIDVCWIILGIGICLQSVAYRLWTPAGPGSGFIPFLTGVPIALSGILLLFGAQPAAKFWESVAGMKKVVLVTGCLCLMAILMPWLGFLLTSVLVFIIMVRVIEPRGWGLTIAVSLVSCILIYFLFRSLMQIKLPTGIFGI